MLTRSEPAPMRAQPGTNSCGGSGHADAALREYQRRRDSPYKFGKYGPCSLFPGPVSMPARVDAQERFGSCTPSSPSAAGTINSARESRAEIQEAQADIARAEPASTRHGWPRRRFGTCAAPSSSP